MRPRMETKLLNYFNNVTRRRSDPTEFIKMEKQLECPWTVLKVQIPAKDMSIRAEQ